MLDFLISPAHAQAAPASNALMQFLPLVVLLALFYFLLIRPQMRRTREHRDMLAKLAKGDEVIAGGGLAGVLRDIGEHFITIEIADNVPVKMQKSSIVSVLPKGTLKSL
ncbi:MAG: preprotein translocase subunit YajC [Nevskiales bacterium]|nr:preprotein translocase subunit YajC [Nevskiales bacterium]